MVLEASNYQYIHGEGYDISSDASFNTEEWYSIHNPTYLNYHIIQSILPIDYSNNTPSIPDDVSHTFNVRYYNPAKFNGDTSYYILDLSSLDPEGFDVCYEIQTANNDYLTHDWSWNLDGSKVYIIVPGEDKSNPEDLDFSFEIISHDNSVEDVSGFVPTDYYSFNGEDVSKRIVNFHKEIFKPELLKINVDVFDPTIIKEYYGSSNIINEFVDKDYQVSNNTVTLYLNYPNIHDTEDISYIITFNYNKTQGFNLTPNVIQTSYFTQINTSDSEVKFISTINPFTEINLGAGVELYGENIDVTNENTNVSSSTVSVIIMLKQYYYINNFRYRIYMTDNIYYDNIYTDNGVIDLNSEPFQTDFYLDNNPTINIIANLKTFYDTGLDNLSVIDYTTKQPGQGAQDIIQTINYSDIFPKTSTASTTLDAFASSMTHLSNEVTVNGFESKLLQEYNLNTFLEIKPNLGTSIYKDYKFKMPSYYISQTLNDDDVILGGEGSDYVLYKIKSNKEVIIDMKRIKYNSEEEFNTSKTFIKIWRISKGTTGGNGGDGFSYTIDVLGIFYIYSKMAGGGGGGGKNGDITGPESYKNVERLHFKSDNSIDIIKSTSWNESSIEDVSLSEYLLVSGGGDGENGTTHTMAAPGGGGDGYGRSGDPGSIVFNQFANEVALGGGGGGGAAAVTRDLKLNYDIDYYYDAPRGGDGGDGGHASLAQHGSGFPGVEGEYPEYNRIVVIEKVSSNVTVANALDWVM
jgi:hypothetical protein